jgi:hypothetical protein
MEAYRVHLFKAGIKGPVRFDTFTALFAEGENPEDAAVRLFRDQWQAKGAVRFRLETSGGKLMLEYP